MRTDELKSNHYYLYEYDNYKYEVQYIPPSDGVPIWEFIIHHAIRSPDTVYSYGTTITPLGNGMLFLSREDVEKYVFKLEYIETVEDLYE